MRASKRRLIEAKASELLQKSKVTKAPVNVEKIANDLGIAVRRTPTEDDISGFLVRNAGEQPVIGVNTLHHPNRQRFTIAHELGHFELHTNEVHVDRVIVQLRSGESSSGENPDEVEANRFAAELLMPADFILRDVATLLKQGDIDFSDDKR
ncbi:MAG TPA: ImmA/IrrE family metallo-endopeptidase, partial [Pyrinomonadaceae bacterium]|nr:ImmA/IrrE family metallo-endopeptidase [Pyrinomonadaceae bacterium]